jgi:hypothetical protein
MRRVILGAQGVPASAIERFGGNGVVLFGTTLAVWQELVAVGVFALVFLGLAIRGFSKTE